MSENISATIEFVVQCIACLSDDISGVQSNAELAKIYEELIQEQITEKLNENSYIFCAACEEHLRNFNTFRDICKESWRKLAEHFNESWACELEQLLGESPISAKQEECEEKVKNLVQAEDEIFLVDSDSEASTLPLDPESDTELVPAGAIETSEEILVFVDVLDFSNIEEVVNGDSVPSTNESKNGDENASISEQTVDSSRQTPVVQRESLFSLGLLPKSVNNLSICNVCHISTKNIKSHYITAHTTVELDRFICSGCTIIHKTKEQMIKHIKTYHTLYLKPRKCTFCNDAFIESGEYRRHTFGHQRAVSKFVCNICGKIEKKRSSLQSHVMRIHNGSLYCKYCYKVAFSSDEQYSSHMRIEEEKRAESGYNDYVCDICGFKTRYKQQLRLHVQNLHKIPRDRNLPCHVCDKKFSSSESLRHHIKFMHKKKYKCTECDQLFGFLKDVRYHYQRDHTDEGLREPCDICGKIFSKKALPLHKNTIHSDIKPFQCNVCDKAFKQKVMLKTHMYKHTGFRPYFCNICNRGYYDSPILEKHFLREHGKKVTHEDIKRDCKRKPVDQSHF